jgi:hypothetical protein
MEVIKHPIVNCINLLRIGRNPSARIFLFSMKKRSNQEMASATKIPIIDVVGIT